MAQFTWKAIDAAGRKSSGELDAATVGRQMIEQAWPGRCRHRPVKLRRALLRECGAQSHPMPVTVFQAPSNSCFYSSICEFGRRPPENCAVQYATVRRICPYVTALSAKTSRKTSLRRTFCPCRFVRRNVGFVREAALPPLPFLGVSSLMNWPGP